MLSANDNDWRCHASRSPDHKAVTTCRSEYRSSVIEDSACDGLWRYIVSISTTNCSCSRDKRYLCSSSGNRRPFSSRGGLLMPNSCLCHTATQGCRFAPAWRLEYCNFDMSPVKPADCISSGWIKYDKPASWTASPRPRALHIP